MNHEALARQDEPQGSSDRGFGLVFSAVFLILAALAYLGRLPFSLSPDYLQACPWASSHPKLASQVLPLLFALASLVFLGFALLLPKALAPLNWVWTKFGLLLHKLVSPIVLGLMFFAIFTPVGAIMRLFGGDPLRLRFEPKAKSYWIERSPPGPGPDSLKDQF